jgi:hypothetical protein
MEDLTRRSALARGFGGVALVCSFKFDKRVRPSGKRTSAIVRSAANMPFEPFQRDLPLPPVAKPISQTRRLQKYVVTTKPANVEILPGCRPRCWPTTVTIRGRRSMPPEARLPTCSMSTTAGAT